MNRLMTSSMVSFCTLDCMYLPHMLPSTSTLVPCSQHCLHYHQGNGIWICPCCTFHCNSKVSQGYIIVTNTNLLHTNIKTEMSATTSTLQICNPLTNIPNHLHVQKQCNCQNLSLEPSMIISSKEM
jgi:hypothetical protein